MSKLNKTLSLSLLGWGFTIFSLESCNKQTGLLCAFKVGSEEVGESSEPTITDEEIADAIKKDDKNKFADLLDREPNLLVTKYYPQRGVSSQNITVISAICVGVTDTGTSEHRDKAQEATKANCIEVAVNSGAMLRLINGDFGMNWIKRYAGLKVENPMVLLTRASNQKPRQEFAKEERRALKAILRVQGIRGFTGWDLTNVSAKSSEVISDCRPNLSEADTRESMARNMGVSGTPTRGKMFKEADEQGARLSVQEIISAIELENKNDKKDKYWLCTRRSLLLALDEDGSIRKVLGKEKIIDNIFGPEVLVPQIIERMEDHIMASNPNSENPRPRDQKWLLRSALIVDEIDFDDSQRNSLGKKDFIADVILGKGVPLEKKDKCVIS